jgi:hypothetical protein
MNFPSFIRLTSSVTEWIEEDMESLDAGASRDISLWSEILVS